MTLEEAKANVGKPFKWLGATSGAAAQFDTIRGVSPDGTVYGEWLAAHHDDCRLKGEQPEHLKKHDDESIQPSTSDEASEKNGEHGEEQSSTCV